MPLQVRVLTPTQTCFTGEAAGLTVPAYRGFLGVLPGHAPLVCALQAGPLTLRLAEGDKVIRVTGGFMEVFRDQVVVLAEGAEAPA